MPDFRKFISSRPISEIMTYQKYGVAPATPAVGTSQNPASSLSEIRSYYELALGQSPQDGVYYIQPTSTSFATYCLFNKFDGNDWMLMFMINADNQSLDYDASYWTARDPLNASESNLNYVTNRTTNVATGAVNNFPFRYMALSSYGQNLNLDTYATGSATNSSYNLLTSYTSVGIAMNPKTGSGSLTEPWDNPSGGTAGSQFRYNQSSTTAVSGNAYARWGQAQYTEPYASSYFTFRYYGLGAKGDHACSSSYSGDFDFGKGSGRHSAGGCSDNPSGSGTFTKHEIWVR